MQPFLFTLNYLSTYEKDMYYRRPEKKYIFPY